MGNNKEKAITKMSMKLREENAPAIVEIKVVDDEFSSYMERKIQDDTYRFSVLADLLKRKKQGEVFSIEDEACQYFKSSGRYIHMYLSDGLYVSSEGDTCGMPHYFRQSADKLAKAQRKLRHKTIGSKNYNKQQKRTAKIHRHIANQRKDFLQKKSTEIANQYSFVCVEDLNMKAMANRGFGNGKATLDNGYGMFLTMLDYKLRDRGGQLIKVGRFFPSSQLCSHCGFKNPLVKNLSIRHWDCPNCGTTGIDRDVNAAKNIKKEGIRLLTA